MRREIDILVKAANKNCAVVEKASNLLWTRDELLQAADEGRFLEPGDLTAPEAASPVSGPFPCCGTGTGDAASAYYAIGQTRHFVIFAASASPALSR
jgi:hypothetical protein